jgi:hypothetical protein
LGKSLGDLGEADPIFHIKLVSFFSHDLLWENFVRKVKFEFQSIRGKAETICPKDWGSVFNRKSEALHQEQVVRAISILSKPKALRVKELRSRRFMALPYSIKVVHKF